MCNSEDDCAEISIIFCGPCGIHTPTIGSPLAESTPIHVHSSMKFIQNAKEEANYLVQQRQQQRLQQVLQEDRKKKRTVNKSRTSLTKNRLETKRHFTAVQLILFNLGLTKYVPKFQNVNMNKFITLKVIDLNAMGITRPMELDRVLTAIKNPFKYIY